LRKPIPRDRLAYLRREVDRAREHLHAALVEATLLERSVWLPRGRLAPAIAYGIRLMLRSAEAMDDEREARRNGLMHPVWQLPRPVAETIARRLKAHAFLPPDDLCPVRMSIPSQSDPALTYVLGWSHESGLWTCSCPGYQRTRPGHCKHVAAAGEVIAHAGDSG